MNNSNCTCGHLWSDHYDGAYCLNEECCCGPCVLCKKQFVENPVNNGFCLECKAEIKLIKEQACVQQK